jgi:hypothetical protein
MESHPQRKVGEVFIGYHSNQLMRLSVLPGIRQCTESGEPISLTNSFSNDSKNGAKIPTFAPFDEIRTLQLEACKKGGTP